MSWYILSWYIYLLPCPVSRHIFVLKKSFNCSCSLGENMSSSSWILRLHQKVPHQLKPSWLFLNMPRQHSSLRSSSQTGPCVINGCDWLRTKHICQSKLNNPSLELMWALYDSANHSYVAFVHYNEVQGCETHGPQTVRFECRWAGPVKALHYIL